jgi:hypothetical protein
MGDRAEGEKRQVKYRYREFYNEEEREVTYRNRFISYQVITRETVGVIAEYGRAGWGREGMSIPTCSSTGGITWGTTWGRGRSMPAS